MRFFFDNQLSPYLAEAIGALSKPAKDEVAHLRSKFPQNTKDTEWIPALAKEGGWIVISGDLNIIRTRAEKPIWKEAKLTGFFLKAGWIEITPWEQAAKLVRVWPLIIQQAGIAAPGSTYLVPVSGNKIETV